VRRLPLHAWRTEWLEDGCYAFLLRRPDTTARIRAGVVETAESMLGLPYDWRTLLHLGRVYGWWTVWRWYAEWLALQHKPSPGAVTCSEFVWRCWMQTTSCSNVASDWYGNPDSVSPSMIVDSGLWTNLGRWP